MRLLLLVTLTFTLHLMAQKTNTFETTSELRDWFQQHKTTLKKHKSAHTQVIQGDMFKIAYADRAKGEKITLFSFANPKRVPSGKKPGSQEATLSYQSGGDYYTRAIAKFRERDPTGKKVVLGSGDTLFLQDVLFKGQSPTGGDISVDVVLAAAPNLGVSPVKSMLSNYKSAQGKSADLTAYMTHLNNTLEAVFLTALKHGDTHLILGEWGMGIFENPQRLVIEAYKNAVRLYGQYFTQIDFVLYGTPGGKPSKNLLPFQRAFGTVDERFPWARPPISQTRTILDTQRIPHHPVKFQGGAPFSVGKMAGGNPIKKLISSSIIAAKKGASIEGKAGLLGSTPPVLDRDIAASQMYTYDQALEAWNHEATKRGPKVHSHTTVINVTQEDTLDAAKRLKSQGLNPLAIDMANASKPGGGVVTLHEQSKGTPSQDDWVALGAFNGKDYYMTPHGQGNVQEEKILYRGNGSLLYILANWKSLAMDHHWFHMPNNPRNIWDQYFIPEDGAILAPRTKYIGAYTNAEQTKFIYTDPYEVDIAAIASFRHKDRHLSGKAHDAYHWPELESDSVFKERMRMKIENLFLLALLNNNDAVVAGAIGAGAFQVPVDIIVEIYKELAKKYGGFFKNITFAIYDPSKAKRNFNAFDKAFKDKKTYTYAPEAQGIKPWFPTASTSKPPMPSKPATKPVPAAPKSTAAPEDTEKHENVARRALQAAEEAHRKAKAAIPGAKNKPAAEKYERVTRRSLHAAKDAYTQAVTALKLKRAEENVQEKLLSMQKAEQAYANAMAAIPGAKNKPAAEKYERVTRRSLHAAKEAHTQAVTVLKSLT